MSTRVPLAALATGVVLVISGPATAHAQGPLLSYQLGRYAKSATILTVQRSGAATIRDRESGATIPFTLGPKKLNRLERRLDAAAIAGLDARYPDRRRPASCSTLPQTLTAGGHTVRVGQGGGAGVPLALRGLLTSLSNILDRRDPATDPVAGRAARSGC